MRTAEERYKFIIENSRLEGLECTPEEKERLWKLTHGKISTEEALKEVFEKCETKSP